MSETIHCPQCDCAIEVAEALSAQLRSDLKRQFEADLKAKQVVIDKREAAVAEARSKLAQREQELARERTQLDERVAEQLAARLSTEQKRIAKEADERARQQLALELQEKDLALKSTEQQLTAAAQKLKAAGEAELQLRRQQRELEEQREQLELTVTRRLDEERAKAIETGQRMAAEQLQLKIDEAEKRNRDLVKQLEEAQRKAAQGSQQLQGEVLELSLESSLRTQFPSDEISPVAKGVDGADVVQAVLDRGGNNCGEILWESKRTKNWSDSWLPKLRDDQRAAKAQLAVLVTTALPKDCTTFKYMDGVWVTSMSCALSLASALRTLMIQVAAAKRTHDGRNEKSDQLFGYITGPEFRHRFEGVMESLFSMRGDLEQEQRAMQRIWAKRDKQIERGIEQAALLHGNLEGILGVALPASKALELPGLPEPGDDGIGDSSAVAEEAFALLAAPEPLTRSRKRRTTPAGQGERE